MPAPFSLATLVASLATFVLGALVGIHASLVVVPSLRSRRAKPVAELLALLLSLAAAATIGVLVFMHLQAFWFIGPLAALVLISPRLLSWVTGGPRPLTAAQSAVAELLAEADARRSAGDADGWRSSMDRLSLVADSSAATLVDALGAYRRELERGAPPSSATLERLDVARHEFFAAQRPQGKRSIATAVLVTGLLAAGPAAAQPFLNPTACQQAEAILDAAAPRIDVRPTNQDLATLLVPDYPDGSLVAEGVLDLRAAADTRFDPDTLRQLRSSQFTRGYARQWQLPDGRQASVDVFEFASASGAFDYHATVTHYACKFANEAFVADPGAIGMQIRYRHGDPTAEQIAFVLGARRYVAAIGFSTPPADHSAVIELATRQNRQLRILSGG